MKLIPLLVVITLAMQGCSSIEEGEVDYVRTIANKSTRAESDLPCSAELYQQSEYTRAGVTRSCYETLYRKYSKVPQIEMDENISVHLMQAYNAFSSEMRSPVEFIKGKEANAEVVVIANVCEQGVDGCSLQFGPETDKKGRVIYYSNGVKKNQYLNFSYLPVYGPIKYQGGPLIIQISIIELDYISEQQKNLFSVLADMGKKAYPPASAALQVLDTVGSTLLESSSDDILFRYTMTLVPQSNSENYQSPIVAEGNYAFVRKNTSQAALQQELFTNIKFDNLSGRLVKKCVQQQSLEKSAAIDASANHACTLNVNTGQSYQDYRDNSYLTFQIKSGFSPSSLNNIQTFDSLLSEINAQSDEGALKAIDAFTALKQQVSSRAQYNGLTKKLNDIENIVARAPEELFEKFSLEMFRFLNDYETQLTMLEKAKCAEVATTPACESLITETLLTKIQLDMRTLLHRINPHLSSTVTTLIPSGMTPLPVAKRADLQTKFEDGYKVYFNKMIMDQYIGKFNVIKNLSTNIVDLAGENADTKYINARKAVLRSELSHYLRALANDASLMLAGDCKKIQDGSCYRYPDRAQFITLENLLAGYAEGYNIPKSERIEFSATEKEFSLTTNEINRFVDKVLAHL